MYLKTKQKKTCYTLFGHISKIVVVVMVKMFMHELRLLYNLFQLNLILNTVGLRFNSLKKSKQSILRCIALRKLTISVCTSSSLF